jgi:hypothetical protein
LRRVLVGYPPDVFEGDMKLATNLLSESGKDTEEVTDLRFLGAI